MKRIISTAITLSLLLTMLSQPAWATQEQSETVIQEEIINLDLNTAPDNDELFDQYVEQSIFEMSSISLFTAPLVGDNLSDTDKYVYNELKKKIEVIAANGGSTDTFEIDLSDKGVTYTIKSTSEGYVIDTISGLNISNIISALLTDCSYELYWFDKTFHYYSISGMSSGTSQYTATSITFMLPVVADYQGDSIFTVSNDKITLALSAKETADSVIETARNKSTTYEQLLYCFDYIKENAVYGTPGTYGNTYQMISVFDGRSDTNPVCEGYSKAFKYLCDGIGVDCYLVSGTLGAPHMWNIVTLDDVNYLVDVTNCDDNTVGNPDKLFLKGYSSKQDTSYKFSFKSTSSITTVTFTYDAETIAMFDGTGILDISPSDYVIPELTTSITISENDSNYDTINAQVYCTEEGNTLYCAAYNANGILLEAMIQNLSAGSNPVNFTPTNVAETSSVKLFVLNSEFIPMCPEQYVCK